MFYHKNLSPERTKKVSILVVAIIMVFSLNFNSFLFLPHTLADGSGDITSTDTTTETPTPDTTTNPNTTESQDTITTTDTGATSETPTPDTTTNPIDTGTVNINIDDGTSLNTNT
jgi:hypothetical protein